VKGRSSTLRASAGSASYGEDSGGSGSSSVLGSAGEPDAAADDAGASEEEDEHPAARRRRRTGVTREAAARVRFTIFMPCKLRPRDMSWGQLQMSPQFFAGDVLYSTGMEHALCHSRLTRPTSSASPSYGRRDAATARRLQIGRAT